MLQIWLSHIYIYTRMCCPLRICMHAYASECICMHPHAFICTRHASVCTHMPPHASIRNPNAKIQYTWSQKKESDNIETEKSQFLPATKLLFRTQPDMISLLNMWENTVWRELHVVIHIWNMFCYCFLSAR